MRREKVGNFGKTSLVIIDAETCALRVGELVRRDQIVGKRQHRPVQIPYDATVESICVDTWNHRIVMTILACYCAPVWPAAPAGMAMVAEI
jgi:hypothetical protein